MYLLCANIGGMGVNVESVPRCVAFVGGMLWIPFSVEILVL